MYGQKYKVSVQVVFYILIETNTLKTYLSERKEISAQDDLQYITIQNKANGEFETKFCAARTFV